MTATQTQIGERPKRALVERRFPLDLHPRIARIRDLYEQSKRFKWNPERSIPWTEFDGARHSEAVREVARFWWSACVWTEFGRIAETPALLIRFCLERGGESDAKMFLATRGTQEVLYLESATRYAGLLGGFIESPPEKADEATFEQQLYQHALDPDVQPLAYIGAQCAIRDGLLLEHLREALRGASEPVATAILKRAVRDKEAQASFGWLYLEETRAAWTPQDQADLVTEITAVLSGDGPMKHRVVEACYLRAKPQWGDGDGTAALAALGVPEPEALHAITRRFVGDARGRLAGLGIELPDIACPRLGRL